MNETTSGKALTRIEEAADLYHRLVLVVGPTAAGKSRALLRLADAFGGWVTNVNLEASKRLLQLTHRQRRLKLPAVLDEVVEDAGSVVLLDNTELLFEKSLEHDPLKLLQKLSRSRTVVASWNGDPQDGYLIYATPEHPEYRRYPVDDVVVIRPSEIVQ